VRAAAPPTPRANTVEIEVTFQIDQDIGSTVSSTVPFLYRAEQAMGSLTIKKKLAASLLGQYP